MFPLRFSRYIFESTVLHQVALAILTVVVFLVEVVPLELQRRIVNDAVKHRPFSMILTLCAVYAGVALSHGAIKLGLNIYRGWVGQRAVRDLRERIRALESGSGASSEGSTAESGERGKEISMIVSACQRTIERSNRFATTVTRPDACRTRR